VTDLSSLDADGIEPHVGTDFTLADRPEHASLKLTGVRRTGRRHEEGAREGFALDFTGEGADPMPQDTYELQHAELGELAIFLVPVGVDAEGVRYEAVFS
jgi:hypothetical protein